MSLKFQTSRFEIVVSSYFERERNLLILSGRFLIYVYALPQWPSAISGNQFSLYGVDIMLQLPSPGKIPTRKAGPTEVPAIGILCSGDGQEQGLLSSARKLFHRFPRPPVECPIHMKIARILIFPRTWGIFFAAGEPSLPFENFLVKMNCPIRKLTFLLGLLLSSSLPS